MGRTFQPHHAHIPYILQAMTDLNLVGMGYVDLAAATYRDAPHADAAAAADADAAADARPIARGKCGREGAGPGGETGRERRAGKKGGTEGRRADRHGGRGGSGPWPWLVTCVCVC